MMKNLTKLMSFLLAASVLTACGQKEENTETVEQPVEEQKEEVIVDVSAEAEQFKTYATEQMADFVTDTELLVSLVEEGKLEEAQKLYPLVTMYYERLQPITANFTELDSKINGELTEGKESGELKMVLRILYRKSILHLTQELQKTTKRQ